MVVKIEKKKNSFVGPDVVVFYQDERLFVQSIRKINKNQPIDVHFENDLKCSDVMKNTIIFKCSNTNCGISFPLPEKTNEKIIKCPLDTCGIETNIWKKLKRIVELKRGHENAREQLGKVISKISRKTIFDHYCIN